MAEESVSTVSYRCVSGHEIAPDQLDALTEVVSLDAGARVRICREHAAPVAVTVPPGAALEDTSRLD